jgi:hypothetical protein
MNEDWTEIELTVERKAVKEDFILECESRGINLIATKAVQYPFLVRIPGVNV